MSENKRLDLSQYRLEKAKEDFRAAEELYKIELYKQSMNRSYYAIFHAVRALLALDEIDFKKHAGVSATSNSIMLNRESLPKNTRQY